MKDRNLKEVPSIEGWPPSEGEEGTLMQKQQQDTKHGPSYFRGRFGSSVSAHCAYCVSALRFTSHIVFDSIRFDVLSHGVHRGFRGRVQEHLAPRSQDRENQHDFQAGIGPAHGSLSRL